MCLEGQDLYVYCLFGTLYLIIPHSSPVKLVVVVVVVIILVKGIEIQRDK